jgi:enediyne core biosynthesis thioesterase
MAYSFALLAILFLIEEFIMQQSRVQLAYNANSQINPISAGFAQPKTYRQKFETSLKHSNATQNVYFSNFFEWQGSARERWFYECISSDMLQDKGVFITKQAHNNFIREAFPFQTVHCELNSFDIQKCSFYLLFRFYIDGELASSGYQQIVFANKAKKIAKLPDSVLDKIRSFECDYDRLTD